MTQWVDLQIKDNVGRLTLLRDEKHHALHPEMIGEILEVFTELQSNKSIKIVVVQSTGKTFCAGADLDWMKNSINDSRDQNEASAKQLYDMYQAIFSCPKPVIGRVQGSAFGGGVGLISCMDVAIMRSDAHLSLSELKLGLIPSTIAPFLLRKVGMRNLRYYGLCSQRIPASEGQQIGLIHQIVTSDEELDEQVQKYIDMFLGLSPQAIARYKKMCEDIAKLSIHEAKEITSVEIADIRTTKEAQEGLSAFFEKRKPNW